MSLFNSIHRILYSSKFRFCLILCTIFTSSLVFSQNSKVTICHQGTTQEINSNALSAHFEEDGSTKPGHEGDSLGPCEVSNTSPVADVKDATTSEDGSVTITLSGSDQDGDSLSYSITQPSNGSAVLGEDGVTVTYTPDANFNGTDSFTYMANDGTANSAPATVTVSVSAVNDAPVAQNITINTNKNSEVEITLVATDIDVTDELTFTIEKSPINGTLNANNSLIIYTPNLNFSGTDNFVYVANDGKLDSEEAIVSIIVSNDGETIPPYIKDIFYSNKELNKDDTSIITIELSSPSDNFSINDLVSEAGTFNNFSQTTSSTYEVTFIPNIDFQGEGQIIIPQGSFTDQNGAPNNEYKGVISIDTKGPEITITPSKEILSKDQIMTISFEFNEPPNDFDQTMIEISDGGIREFTKVSSTKFVIIYEPPSEITDELDVTIIIAAGQTEDAFGNITQFDYQGQFKIDDSLITASPEIEETSEGESISEKVFSESETLESLEFKLATPLSVTKINNDTSSPGELIFNNDGSYTFNPHEHFYGELNFEYEIVDSTGKVYGPYKVEITVEEKSDEDGIPTILEELYPTSDIDGDGIPDRKADHVVSFPMVSSSKFQEAIEWANSGGIDDQIKPDVSSMGSIVAGDRNSSGNSTPSDNLKLGNISILDKPTLDPYETTSQFNQDPLAFSISSKNSVLEDLDNNPSNGTQVRLTINLPQPIRATTYLKTNALGETFEFLDDQSLDTYDEGATLIDSNNDGLIETVILTITDNGIGDTNSQIGYIDDPGGLALLSPVVDNGELLIFNENTNRDNEALYNFNDRFTEGDEDRDGQQITFSIDDSNSNQILESFSINSTSGVLSVQKSEIFDFELFNSNTDFSQFEVIIKAVDTENNSDLAKLIIKLANINEPPTITNLDQYFVNENISTNEIIFNVSSLPDYNDPPTYSILSGSEFFEIDSESGVLRFKNSPDFETIDKYILKVKSTDTFGDSDEKEIEIFINDLDEIPPVITPSVNNLITNGIIALGTVSANEKVTSWIVEGNDKSLITITSTGDTSASLNLNNASDYKSITSYSFTIKAIDTAGNLAETDAITINVVDENKVEVYPEIDSGQIFYHDITSQVGKINLGKISVTSDNQISFFDILNGFSYIEIDNSGNLWLNLDQNTPEFLKSVSVLPNTLDLNIRAIDSNGKESLITKITIEIFDSNADSDDDGITDLNELINGTNPNNVDTDFDGKSDSEEGIVDSDGDGIIDALESILIDNDNDGLNNEVDKGNEDYYSDSDGDGYKDWEEVIDNKIFPEFFNPLDASIFPPKEFDPDMDFLCVIHDEDDDNDGIEDELDLCPDTPLGKTTNSNGCLLTDTSSFTSNLSLPEINPEDFIIASADTSCSGINDGSIIIESLNISYNFIISFTSSNQTYILNKTEGYKRLIDGLETGTYSFCISLEGFSGYEYCYTVDIGEPQEFNVSTKMIDDKQMLDVKISGSKEYFVELNGLTSKYSTTNASIKLKSGLNKIKIYTDRSCQGIFEEEIFISQELKYYPNPVRDMINLYIGGDDPTANLTIHGFGGDILLQRNIDIPSNRVYSFNISNYSSGIYFLTIKNLTTNKTIKLIKR